MKIFKFFLVLLVVVAVSACQSQQANYGNIWDEKNLIPENRIIIDEFIEELVLLHKEEGEKGILRFDEFFRGVLSNQRGMKRFDFATLTVRVMEDPKIINEWGADASRKIINLAEPYL